MRAVGKLEWVDAGAARETLMAKEEDRPVRRQRGRRGNGVTTAGNELNQGDEARDMAMELDLVRGAEGATLSLS